jgi:flagellar hook-associated protein 2
MGTVSSGIGLVSGIDTASLINQLLAIEARPRQLVERRVAVLQSQKTAFLDINARLLALQTAAKNLGDAKLFETRSVASSNPSAVSATVTSKAAVGSFNIAVSRLVSSHQLITRGFADTDTTTFAATTLRFESHKARLDGDVRLNQLNGYEGVQRGKIRITDRSGASAEIDLTTAVSLNDVVKAISSNASINVTASLDGDRLKLTDDTGQTTANLTVQEVGSTTTAADLGLLSSVAANQITGSNINTLGEASALGILNDGLGVRILGGGQNDLTFALRDGSSVNVSLDGARDIGDVVDKIEAASGDLTAEVAPDGVSLRITDATVGGSTFTISAANGSKAGVDLGIIASDGDADGIITGQRVIAKLGSKLLRNIDGGAGVTTGSIRITNRNGTSSDVNLSAAVSLSDVISTINTSAVGVTASLNSAGTGIKLTDTTGQTTSALTAIDLSGDLAAKLGIDGAATGNVLDGGDADLAYLGENSLLSGLNGGKGVASGKFILTDSNGLKATVDLTQGEKTLGEVIKEINSRGLGLTASINATGDGLLITDTAGGAGTLKVEESGSTTARDLGILKDSVANVIDGSFEKTITVEVTDTLDDIVQKINDGSVGVAASIVNDGSGVQPYRISFASTNGGEAGRVAFDDGGLGFETTTLVEGQDALALFGSADPTQALLLTSSSNTLANTITGVTINLLSTTTTAAQITVSRDDTAVLTTAKSLADAFNGVVQTIAKYDSYDDEKKAKGLLLGDPTVGQIRSRLYSIVNARVTGVSGQYQYLSQIGFKVGDGATLSLDQDKFNAALAKDFDAVVSLLTATQASTSTSNLPAGVTIPSSSSSATKPVGFGLLLEDLVKKITDSIDGSLTRKTRTIDTQVESSQKRIEQLNVLLTIKRERLETEFAAMESALAQLQSQQSALSSLSSLATGV